MGSQVFANATCCSETDTKIRSAWKVLSPVLPLRVSRAIADMMFP